MNKHIHILGICGTFMGGIAALAKQAGYRVTGCDTNVYPPMSTQLETQGIELIQGFDVSQLDLNPDVFVIGNVVSRGNPLVEAILNRNLPYISARNGWRKPSCMTNGYSQSQAPMAKPPPVRCWRGFWNMQGYTLDF